MKSSMKYILMRMNAKVIFRNLSIPVVGALATDILNISLSFITAEYFLTFVNSPS